MTLPELLRRHGLRITTPRQRIFDILKSHDTPLDIATILADRGAVDRVSVYRTLELFIQLGIVTVIPTGWKKRYELADPFKPHHHHLECTACSNLVAIDTPELEHLIESIADTHHYQLSSHHIELRGTCGKCHKMVKSP